LDLRTGTDRRLTTSPGPDEDPVYSPDGQRIAFSSARNGDFKIFTMNADGSDVRQLTDGYGTRPAWSPDGSTIAFVSRPADGSSDLAIHLMNADGSNRRLLPVASNVGQEPTWSPDGQRIAFNDVRVVNDPAGSVLYWQIYTVAVDGSDLRRLSGLTDDDRLPAYSPDGQSIIFSNCNTTCRLFVMNADGTGRRQLTSGSPGDFTPAWSPDGSRVAFARGSTAGSVHLFLIDADGGGLRQLTHGTETSVMPAWHP
jgi:Tol biopolymer transport system component